MSTRMWFYLDETLRLAEHAAASPAFDTDEPDAINEPALLLEGGDGIRLRSNGLPAPTGAHRRTPVYAQGSPAGTGDERRRASLSPEQSIVLPIALHPGRPDGLLTGLRDAAAHGEQWFVVAVDDEQPALLMYPRRTLESPAGDDARWIPTTVRIFGVLGPYPAHVADGYRWFGWQIPRFTHHVATRIAADLLAVAITCQPGSVDLVQVSDAGTVELLAAPRRTARDTPTAARTHTITADSAAMFGVGAYRWCWETVTDDRPHLGPVGGPRCLCPRRCLLCGEPAGTRHAPPCGWRSGSPVGESPRLPAQQIVADAHIHRPGCRHAAAVPGGLFEQISPEGDQRCLICDAVNTDHTTTTVGVAATTEYRSRCTACGATYTLCDLSAVP